MKGIKDVYLHPDSLIGGRLYRVRFKGEVNADISISKEGRFVKLSLAQIGERKKIAAQFKFGKEKNNTVLVWGRIQYITELSMSSRESDE